MGVLFEIVTFINSATLIRKTDKMLADIIGSYKLKPGFKIKDYEIAKTIFERKVNDYGN